MQSELLLLHSATNRWRSTLNGQGNRAAAVLSRRHDEPEDRAPADQLWWRAAVEFDHMVDLSTGLSWSFQDLGIGLRYHNQRDSNRRGEGAVSGLQTLRHAIR